jgi:hypothetical protein
MQADSPGLTPAGRPERSRSSIRVHRCENGDARIGEIYCSHLQGRNAINSISDMDLGALIVVTNWNVVFWGVTPCSIIQLESKSSHLHNRN